MYDQNQNDMKPILAIGIIMLITFLWIYMSPKSPPPAKIDKKVEALKKEKEKAPLKKEVKTKEAVKKPIKVKRITVSEKTEEFDTPLYRATYSNKGATIKSLKLKHYRNKYAKDSGLVEVFDLSPDVNPVFWSFRIDKNEFPSNMTFNIKELEKNRIVFETQLISGSSKGPMGETVVEHLADMLITYNMRENDYRIDMSLELKNRTGRNLDVYGMLKYFSMMKQPKKGSFFLFSRQDQPTKAIYDLNDKIERKVLEKQASSIEALKGDLRWLGFSDKYFMNALLPSKPAVKSLSFVDERDRITFYDGTEALKTAKIFGVDSNVVKITESIPNTFENSPYEITRDGETIYKGSSLKILEEASGCYGKQQSLILDMPRNSKIIDNLFAAQLSYPKRVLKADSNIEYDTTIYAGPKDISILKKIGKDMDKAIDLGDWIGPISRPLLYFLKWLYSLIHNYGMAIIIMTLLVRLLMYPLTAMQSKSMKKMQMLKPEIDKLKAKHGKDKEALNREMMQLWKVHKVNPLGGCFPLLLQLPIFFALYRVLYNAIELRHAPFIFWIKDLSDYDPYFVTPLLMGVSFFLQQKMMPQSMGDEAQQKMMKWMFPIMFTVLMLFLPSGLVLYIFVSTILGIVQQFFNMRDRKKVEAKK